MEETYSSSDTVGRVRVFELNTLSLNLSSKKSERKSQRLRRKPFSEKK